MWVWHTKLLLGVLIVLPLALSSSPSQAQQKVNDGLQEFFRPITSKELAIQLPPRTYDHTFESDNALGNSYSDRISGGCPQEIGIGYITQDTPIYGSVDINVVITSDVVINCGGLR